MIVDRGKIAADEERIVRSGEWKHGEAHLILVDKSFFRGLISLLHVAENRIGREFFQCCSCRFYCIDEPGSCTVGIATGIHDNRLRIVHGNFEGSLCIGHSLVGCQRNLNFVWGGNSSNNDNLDDDGQKKKTEKKDVLSTCHMESFD